MTEPIKRPPIKRVRRGQNQSNIPNKKVKQGAKAGGKGLLIGMGIFIFIIILLIFGFFFYLTSNPNSAKNLGIGASTIKSVTSIFAGLVFGTLFVVFLIMGLSYVYKLATQTTNKGKNTVGAIIIFILGLLNLTFGYIVYARIAKIQVNDIVNNGDILIANINYLDHSMNEKVVPYFIKTFPLIAPIKIAYQLNVGLYRNKERPYIVSRNGSIQEVKFILECGNITKQKLEIYPSQNYKFPQSIYCLYLTKGKKKVKIKLIYNTKNQQNLVYEFSPKEIYIDTNLKVKTSYKLTDAKDEIILGERGDEIQLDLKKIPADLKLKANSLYLDFLGEGNFQKYDGLAKYIYHNDGSFNVVIKIPNIDEAPYYYFPVRVLPPTKPICNITYKEKDGYYTFFINGQKASYPIKSYTYKILNITDGTRLKIGKGKRYKIYLKDGSDYQMEAIVKDVKGKTGTCKSDVINLSNRINYKYDIFVDGELLTGDNIVVKKIPKDYKIEIKNIKPENDKNIGFDIDNDNQIDEEGTEYEFEYTNKKDKIINIILTDDFGNKANRKIEFKVDLNPIIGNLRVSKDTGEAPLKVEFDASSTKLTDEEDKIVYFDWDFDDGNENKDTRQGIVTHTYKKYGTYYPSVTIRTKKGRELTLKKRIDVLKYVNTSRILFPNNLGGQASKGYPLKIVLNTSGAVKSIKWYFGDGNTLSCENRDCASISHTYEKSGRFKIKAVTTYADGSPESTAFKIIYITE